MSRKTSPFAHGRSEAFERRGHRTRLREEQAALARNVRGLRSLRGWTQMQMAEAAGLHHVHVSRIELGSAKPALPTLVAIALAFDVRVEALFAARSAAEKPFVSSDTGDAIPLYDLRAAAGSFGSGRAVEAIDHVVLRGGVSARPGMFVAKVVGQSMEPLIPNGAFCVFAPIKGRLPNGRVVLAQLRGVEDPDTGGAYAVKRLKMEPRRLPRLLPENPAFDEIVVQRVDDVRIVAELVAVLGTRK